MKKLLRLFLLCSVILLVLGACSGNDTDATSTEINNAQNDEVTNDKKDGDGDIVEMSILINHPWYPVSSWEGTIAEAITEATGVSLDVTVASDEQQLQLLIASGDLPDLIFTTRETRLETDELVYPWNELIEKYAPNFEIDPVRLAVNTAPDGNVYTILNAFATPDEWEEHPRALGHDGNPAIGVREDILEELGDPEIETLEDFVDVLEQVKSQYPDMVPLVMDIEWIPQYFQMQHGVPPHGNWYIDDNGEVQHKLVHPNMIDYYKFMNSLQRNEYIISENFTFSNDKIDDEYALSGRAFAHSYTVSVAEANNAALKNQGDDFRFKLIPSALTEQTLNVDSSTGFSGVYITKENPHPDKAIQFLEYLASDEGKELVMFGIEEEQWEWHEDGYPIFHYDVTDSDYIETHGLKWWYFYSDAIVEGYRSYIPGSMMTEALLEIKEITEYHPALGLIRLPSDSEERIISEKIDEMIKNEEINIYMAESEEDAEKAYMRMIELAEDIGLNELTEYANEMYQNSKENFN